MAGSVQSRKNFVQFQVLRVQVISKLILNVPYSLMTSHSHSLLYRMSVMNVLKMRLPYKFYVRAC